MIRRPHIRAQAASTAGKRSEIRITNGNAKIARPLPRYQKIGLQDSARRSPRWFLSATHCGRVISELVITATGVDRRQRHRMMSLVAPGRELQQVTGNADVASVSSHVRDLPNQGPRCLVPFRGSADSSPALCVGVSVLTT